MAGRVQGDVASGRFGGGVDWTWRSWVFSTMAWILDSTVDFICWSISSGLKGVEGPGWLAGVAAGAGGSGACGTGGWWCGLEWSWRRLKRLRRLVEWNKLLEMVDMRLSLWVKVLIQHRILLLKCWDLRLSLSLRLRLLTHWITSTKLTMKSHRLRIPSKVPHRVRDVEKASREHGTSVRLDKKGKQVVNNTWCIHMSCKIRDKAQRPSGFVSQPCKRLKSSTPELRAHLNLTRRPSKGRITIPASTWTCAWTVNSCCKCYRQSVTVARAILKKKVVAAEVYKWQSDSGHWKRIPGHSGQLFNTWTRPHRVRSWKLNDCFTLLKRITRFKRVNSDIRSLHPHFA